MPAEFITILDRALPVKIAPIPPAEIEPDTTATVVKKQNGHMDFSQNSEHWRRHWMPATV